jgi:hypothetical protein
MKNLDLNNYGVQELSVQEAMKVEGGMKFWKALLGFALGALAGFIMYR